MTIISSLQVKNKTEEVLIEQSNGFVNEMNYAISAFLDQFEKGLHLLSTSDQIQQFSVEEDEDGVDTNQLTNALTAQLTEALTMYDAALSVYYADPT